MSEEIYQPNSNGKFEFQFDRGIGKNFTTNGTFSYQFALKKFNSFRDSIGIKDEPCVFEADIDTFVVLLAGILEEYETKHPNNNFLNIIP